jgi:hypothetical protein
MPNRIISMIKTTKVVSNARPERRVIPIVPIRLFNANPKIPKKKANPERPAAKIGVHVRNGVMRVHTDVTMYNYRLDVG